MATARVLTILFRIWLFMTCSGSFNLLKLKHNKFFVGLNVSIKAPVICWQPSTLMQGMCPMILRRLNLCQRNAWIRFDRGYAFENAALFCNNKKRFLVEVCARHIIDNGQVGLVGNSSDSVKRSTPTKFPVMVECKNGSAFFYFNTKDVCYQLKVVNDS